MLGTNKSSGECMAGKSSSLLWIIDTGVLHHVIGDASCLSHINHVTDCPVGLPNGSRALTTLAGSVTFPGGVVLHHMLYVPQLTCILISVSQLIDDSHYIVSFTNSLCAIQDQRLGNLIGADECRDGLYYFRSIPTVQAVIVSELTKFELCHHRLGHPIDRVVKLVHAICSSTSPKKISISFF